LNLLAQIVDVLLHLPQKNNNFMQKKDLRHQKDVVPAEVQEKNKDLADTKNATQ